jgi:dienelactone hydrolase
VQHPLYLITISHRLVTGPVARFARQIASQGYIVAAPSSYHEFTGPEPLAYDGPGTDAGNEWKITKKVSAYDEDAKLSVDILLDLPTCNGRIGATGLSSPSTAQTQFEQLIPHPYKQPKYSQ